MNWCIRPALPVPASLLPRGGPQKCTGFMSYLRKLLAPQSPVSQNAALVTDRSVGKQCGSRWASSIRSAFTLLFISRAMLYTIAYLALQYFLIFINDRQNHADTQK